MISTYFVLALVVLALADAFPGEDSRYENLDVDAICKNKRLLKSYIKCLLDEGPCTAEGRNIKESIPESLESKCASCSEGDKEKLKKAVNCVRCTYEEDWKAIAKHYDPENKYDEVELFGEKSC